MMPVAAALVLMMLCAIGGYWLRVAIEKKLESRPNVFDAFSDNDIARERDVTARTVREYHDSPYYQRTFQRALVYLHELDKEIERRAKEKREIEPAKIDDKKRELAIFDTVYDMVLKDIEKKEIK